MKKAIFLSLFVFISLTINTGCDKLDITKDFDLELEFIANSANADYYDEQILDAAENSSEISDYADKITKIEITEVTVWLTYFNGAPGQKIVTETLSVADESGGGEMNVGTVADQDLQSLLNNPIPLTLNQDGIDLLAKLIKDSPHKALIKNFGSADSGPIDFVCRFKFKVKMTANPL
jgi:hypothetical protein